MENWKAEYQNELNSAIQARSTGNEGMARVCARRAAGIVIGEYLIQRGYSNLTRSVTDRFRLFINLPNVDGQNKDIASHFLMKVNLDHSLPEEIDLINDTILLENALLEASTE